LIYESFGKSVEKMQVLLKINGNNRYLNEDLCTFVIVKGKAIAVRAWRGPEGSRSLRLTDFMTIGTWRW
jgi:hypothetical protein